MERLMILEYNKAQNCFHYNFYTNGGMLINEPNTNGWCPIIHHCSKAEAEIFFAYINEGKKPEDGYEIEFLLKAAHDCKLFLQNLIHRGYAITRA
jgi:hypothetical protein